MKGRAACNTAAGGPGGSEKTNYRSCFPDDRWGHSRRFTWEPLYVILVLSQIFGAAVDTIPKYYRIDRNGIALLKFILESYDNAAVMRTVDEKGSIVELLVSPGFIGDVQAVIAEYRDEFNIQEIERPDGLEPL
jgi:hypothetical protein